MFKKTSIDNIAVAITPRLFDAGQLDDLSCVILKKLEIPEFSYEFTGFNRAERLKQNGGWIVFGKDDQIGIHLDVERKLLERTKLFTIIFTVEVAGYREDLTAINSYEIEVNTCEPSTQVMHCNLEIAINNAPLSYIYWNGSCLTVSYPRTKEKFLKLKRFSKLDHLQSKKQYQKLEEI